MWNKIKTFIVNRWPYILVAVLFGIVVALALR